MDQLVSKVYNEPVASREMTVEECAIAVNEAANAYAMTANEFAKKATEFIDIRQLLSFTEENLRAAQMGLVTARERQGA